MIFQHFKSIFKILSNIWFFFSFKNGLLASSIVHVLLFYQIFFKITRQTYYIEKIKFYLFVLYSAKYFQNLLEKDKKLDFNWKWFQSTNKIWPLLMDEGNEINKLIICKQRVVEESSTMDTNKGGSMRLMRVKLGPTSFFLIRY